MHGVSLIVCICDARPVHSLDLQMIKESCYFATDDLDQMSNPYKRNMIYWWYATTVYSICEEKTRKELPKCLVHAIGREYPSEEYCGFELGAGLNNKN
jgi:hypothetical protein